MISSNDSSISYGSIFATVPERLCVFRLGVENYGIDVRWVRETVNVATIVPVPLALPAITGLTHIRAAPITVVDLVCLLGLPIADSDLPADAEPEILAMDLDGLRFAIRVDATVRVSAYEPANCRPIGGDGGDLFVGVFADPALAAGVLVLDPAVICDRLNALKSESYT